MKYLLLFLSFFSIHSLVSQQILNVYRIADEPDVAYRVELTHNDPEGGMLLAGNLQERGSINVWTGYHVTRLDPQGQVVWSTHLRNSAGYLTNLFSVPGGGAGLLYRSLAGREQMIVFENDGTVSGHFEYVLEALDGRRGRHRIEFGQAEGNGHLTLTAIGQLETNTFSAGHLTVDPNNGSVQAQNFWALIGMQQPSRVIPSAKTNVIYAAGHSSPESYSNIAALTPNGTLLRQWDLLNTMGEYGTHFQVGDQLLLLDIHETDRSLQFILLDAGQDDPVWTTKIPLRQIAGATNLYQGQMLPKFSGYDEEYLYFWMDPVAPTNRAPQLMTLSRLDGSIVQVQQEAATLPGPEITDVLREQIVRATSGSAGQKRLFIYSEQRRSTIFLQRASDEETPCSELMEPTDDYTRAEELKISQRPSSLETEATEFKVTVIEKPIADLRARALDVLVRRLCGPSQNSDNSQPDINEVVTGIFPNPTFDRVTVAFNPTEEDEQPVLQIHDLWGQNITVIKQDQGEGNIEVNLSHLPSGVYLISVIWDGQRLVERIVKQ